MDFVGHRRSGDVGSLRRWREPSAHQHQYQYGRHSCYRCGHEQFNDSVYVHFRRSGIWDNSVNCTDSDWFRRSDRV